MKVLNVVIDSRELDMQNSNAFTPHNEKNFYRLTSSFWLGPSLPQQEVTRIRSGEESRMSGNPTENIETNVLNRLVETIQDVPKGLDPNVLATWYAIIEADSKTICPTEELRDSIHVIQNLDLPMKFEFKSSKRAIPFVVEAIENNLNSMPFATRLYFQKFEEIMEAELRNYKRSNPFP